MRILLIMIQVAILAATYLFVVVPVMATAVAAVGGVLYIAVTEPSSFLALTVHGIFAVISHNIMVYLGYSTAITASLPGIISFLIATFLPWAVAIAANLACGFLAYYRTFNRKARRVGIVINALALLYYCFPLVLAFVATYDISGFGAELLVCAIVGAPIVGYFALSIHLLRRMPERPDIEASVKAMPSAHKLLWCFLAMLCAAGIALVRVQLGAAAVVIGAVVLLSALPFFYNARVTRRIAGERKQLFAWAVLAANAALTLVCLVLLPPIGVALLFSTLLLFFLLEMLFVLKERPRPAPDPAGP